MSILDVVDYVKRQARLQGINDSELARRASISRPAMLKLLNGLVKCPELTTLANLAYAIDDHPYHLVSLYLGGIPPPLRDGWSARGRRDNSRFIRDVTCADGTIVMTGQKFIKVWEIANAGENFWVGRKLICVDQNSQLYRKIGNDFVPLDYSLIPEVNEVVIPDTAPGCSVKIEVGFIAPASPAWVVSYWKMVDRDGELCFPEFEGLRCCVSVMVV